MGASKFEKMCFELPKSGVEVEKSLLGCSKWRNHEPELLLSKSAEVDQSPMSSQFERRKDVFPL